MVGSAIKMRGGEVTDFVGVYYFAAGLQTMMLHRTQYLPLPIRFSQLSIISQSSLLSRRDREAKTGGRQ